MERCRSQPSFETRPGLDDGSLIDHRLCVIRITQRAHDSGSRARANDPSDLPPICGSKSRHDRRWRTAHRQTPALTSRALFVVDCADDAKRVDPLEPAQRAVDDFVDGESGVVRG